MKVNTDFIIREFYDNDEHKVKKLILQGMKEHWGWIDENANPDIENISRSCGSKNFFTAWAGQILVGTGGLIAESDTVVRIARMAVDNSFRRTGIGTQILNHLISVAKQRGFREVVLETTDNWEDAINFYKKNGFIAVQHREGNIHFSMKLV